MDKRKSWQPRSRPRSKAVYPWTLAAKVKRAEPVNGKSLRPRKRGDCIGGPRPCPFVSCRHHLYLDILPPRGSLKLNFPELDVSQIPETCSLDAADQGGMTLQQVGDALNLTRERIRQIILEIIGKVGDYT